MPTGRQNSTEATAIYNPLSFYHRGVTDVLEGLVTTNAPIVDHRTNTQFFGGPQNYSDGKAAILTALLTTGLKEPLVCSSNIRNTRTQKVARKHRSAAVGEEVRKYVIYV